MSRASAAHAHRQRHTGAYGSESVWNETDVLGGLAEGGSGVSNVYSRPNYQSRR